MPGKFSISIDEEALSNLKTRLSQTRYPDQFDGVGHDYGLNSYLLRDLVEYWSKEFDWPEQEKKLNMLGHHRVSIDGVGIHFVHARSARKDAMPLIMLHGWPSSFVQMLDIVPLLTEPSADQPAFHVVIPSLPGFGFSDVPTTPGMSVGKIAPIMHRLMTEELDYARYGIRSSDLGAGVASSMALRFEAATIGSHTGGTNPYLAGPVPGDLSPEEETFVQAAQSWMQNEMAYAQLHSSKPQTLAAALNDSPAGILAWIGEKFLRWTDNNGQISDAISLDSFFTNLTVYWATETINSSMRLYYETDRAPSGWGRPNIPVGYLMPKNDMFPTPRSWIARQGPIAHWTETESGGHFMEWEEPQIVADDLRKFFGSIQE